MDKNADVEHPGDPGRGGSKDVERGHPTAELAITAKADSPPAWTQEDRPHLPREHSRSESRHSGHRPRSSSIDPGYISELIAHALTEFFKGSGQKLGKNVIKTIAEKFIQNSARIVEAEGYTIDGKAIPGLFDIYDVGFDEVTFDDPEEGEDIEDGVIHPPLRGTWVMMDGVTVKVLVTQASGVGTPGTELVIKKKVTSQVLIETLFNNYHDRKNFTSQNTFIQLGLKSSLGFHADMCCFMCKKAPPIFYALVAMIIQMATPLLMVVLLLFPNSTDMLNSNMDDVSRRICPAQSGLLNSVYNAAKTGNASQLMDSTLDRNWTIDMIIAKAVAGCCMIVMLGSTYKAFEKSTSAARSYIHSYAYYSCCGYFDMLWSFVLCFIIVPGASYVVFLQEPDQGKAHEVPMYMLTSLVAFGFLLEVPTYMTALPGNDFSDIATKHMIEYYLANGERDILGCCNWTITKWILSIVQLVLAIIWIFFTLLCFDMKLDLISVLED